MYAYEVEKLALKNPNELKTIIPILENIKSQINNIYFSPIIGVPIYNVTMGVLGSSYVHRACVDLLEKIEVIKIIKVDDQTYVTTSRNTYLLNNNPYLLMIEIFKEISQWE